MSGNEIDLLMNLDPLDLTAEDVEKVVAYQRRLLANYEAGVKPEKQRLASVKGSALLEKLKIVPAVKLTDRRM